MTKPLIIAGIFLFLLASCNNSKKEERNISQRDRSVSAANAYNNLFFDSTVLVKFFTENKTDDDFIQKMTSFYNARNYQFAWFTNNGLTEQARGFWNMHEYQINYANDSSLKDKKLKIKMNRFTAKEDGFTVSVTDKNILYTELKLTEHFMRYTMNNFEAGVIQPTSLQHFIPIKKVNPVTFADSILSPKKQDNKQYEAANAPYRSLKEKLTQYIAIYRQGGWAPITGPAKQLKKGRSSPAVIQVKKRLQLTGDMEMDTTAVFNAALESGIKNFQLRFGYTPTGLLSDSLLRDMNVPVLKRIEQILINMGRMQWMIHQPEGQMIVVNIPEFILHVKDGTKKVFDMEVVVGKDGHNTMMFTGNLDQIVFSPYWNLPPSIVENEVIPAMEEDGDYLDTHHMEITGTEDGIPVIRQLPGEKNALGKVKFLFPNSFNIYFHDTPEKSLFQKDKRAFSHGCIRLSEPVKLANYLLKDDGKWSPEEIDSAMNSGKEKYVKLRKPIPVLITYYTAWVDDNGLLHFADDIYGHDQTIREKMFTTHRIL